MSGNDFSALCDHQKLMDFIYDIDDSEIFARGPLNSSSEETEGKLGKSSGHTDVQKEELIQENETLKESLENLKKEKEVLQLRISELYKTARAELERKDRRLKDLEKEKDSILFRRANNFHQRKLEADKQVPLIEIPEEKNENLPTKNYRIPKKKIVQETNKACNIGDPYPNNNNTFNTDRSKVLQDTEIAQRTRVVCDVNRENEKVKVTRTIEDKYRNDHRSREPHVPSKHNEVKTSLPTYLKRKGPRTPSKEREPEALATRPKKSKLNEEQSRPKEARRPPSPPAPKKVCLNTFRRKSGSPSNDYRHSCFGTNKMNQEKPSSSRDRHPEEDHLRKPPSPSEENVPPGNSRAPYQRSRSRGDPHRSRSNCRSTHFEDDKQNTLNKVELNANHRSKSGDGNSEDHRRNDARSSSRDKEVKDNSKNPYQRSRSRGDNQRARSNCRSTNFTDDEQDSLNKVDSKSYHRRNDGRSSSRDRETIDLNLYDRSKSRDRETKNYGRNDYRRRHSRSSSRHKDEIDERKDLHPNDRGKSRDRKPRDQRKNYSGRRQSRSSSRDKDCKDNRLKHSSKDGKDIDPKSFDLREKCSRTGRERQRRKPGLRRSRSASDGRFSKRSPERDRYGVRQRGSARNEGNRKRSRSNSFERMGKNRSSDKIDHYVRRDRFGNVIQDKYKENRNRSKSRERFQSRSRNSRPRDVGTLRERLLRYSMDRERQAVERTLIPDSKITGNFRDKKMASADNDADFSDLDDLKLHLSGESDLDSFHAKDKRDDAVYSDVDEEVELLKDLGLNIDEMTDEQLERLIEEKKKHLVKEGTPINEVIHDQEDNFTARFSGEEDHLSEHELIEDLEPKDKKNYFTNQNFVEELDYEASQDGMITDKVNFNRNNEKKTENKLIDNIRSGIPSRNVVQTSDVDNRYDNLNRRGQKNFSDDQIDRGNFKTLFDARQQRKKSDNNQTREQTNKTPQINRRNTEAIDDKSVNIMKEDREKFGNRQKKQDIDKTERRTSNERNKFEKIKEEGYKSLMERVEKIKQGCSATSMEVESIKTQALKKLDLVEKKDPKAPNLEQVLLEGKYVDKNQTEVVKPEETKKKEKISFSVYRSRRQSTEQRITETEVIDLGNCESNVPIPKSDLPTNKDLEINNVKQSVKAQSEHVDIKPNCSSEVERVNEKNRNPNIFKQTESDEKSEQYLDSNKPPEEFQSNKSNAENLVETAGSNTITQDDKLQQEETNQESNQVVVIDDTSSVLDISDLQSKQAVVTSVNNSCNDKNSFIHDLSISDDDEEDEEPVSNRNSSTDIGEMPSEGKSDKIRILSNITIQSPSSYTPPLPKNSSETAEERSKNREPKSPKKSRRSLFQITEIENQEFVKIVTENEIETKCTSNSTLQINKEAVNSLQNTSNEFEYGSLASNPHLQKETPEYVEEIEAVMSHLIGNPSFQNSPRVTAIQSKGALNTEELQKCLEEDIGQNMNKQDKKEAKLHTPLKSDKFNKKTNLIEDNAHDLRSKKLDVKNVIKRQSQRQKNKKANAPSPDPPPVEKQEESKEALYERIFGEMTPSPCKPSEEPQKEPPANVAKAKRNLMKEVCHSSNGDSCKVQDKIDHDKNKTTTNKKGDSHNNEKIKPRKQVLRNRSKSVDVKMLQNLSDRLEKSDPGLNEQSAEKRIVVNLPNFCSNPTYIPTLHNKQSIFESPNHYIMKKNQENLKKRPPSLDRNSPAKTHNLSKSSEDQTIETFESTSSSTHGDSYILEDEDTFKNSASTKQPTKKRKFAKMKQVEDIDDTKGKTNKTKINSRKAGDKEATNVKQTKKNVTKNHHMEKRKNNKTPSFKIKFNRRKKNKKESEEELSDSSDFEETPSKKNLIEKHLKIQEIMNKAKNKKRELEENENVKKATEESASDMKNIKTISKKVKPIKETKPKPETSKPKKGRNVNKKKEQKDKTMKEQICDKIEEEISGDNTENKELDLRKEPKESKHDGIYVAEKEELDQAKQLKEAGQVQLSEESTDKKDSQRRNETKVKHTPEKNDKALTVNNTTQIQHQESLKTIKRITPQRIGDSWIKQKDVKVKRELFTDSQKVESTSNKRKRLSSSTGEIRPEKTRKVTYTESMETVESEVMDNAAHTSIRVQENRLELTVSSKQSPLPNMEQIYEACSKNVIANDPLSTVEVIPLTSEDQEPRVVQLHIAETSFPEINLDTKDIAYMSELQKEIFFNLSAFNLTDKSLGVESKNKSDSGDGNTATANENDFSFSNFLNKSQSTSTPVKNTVPVLTENNDCEVVFIETTSEKGEAHNRQQKPTSTSGTPVQTLSSQSAAAGSNNTAPVVSLKPATKVNVSDDKLSSELTSAVSSNSNNSKGYARFSGPLKRDRRRPISVRLID